MTAPARAPAARPDPTPGDLRPSRAIWTALTGTVLAALPVFLFGGLAPLMRRELEFGVEGIGIGVGVFFAVSAAISVPAGRFGERVGARRAILAGAAANGVSLAAVAAAGNVAHVFVALALGGVGNAVIQPAANLLVTQHVRSGRQGLAFGIKQAAVPASALLGGLAVAAGGETLGWRGSFLVGTTVVAAVALLTPVDLPRPRDISADERRALHRITASLLLLAVAAALANGAANTLSSYLVEYGIDSGWTDASAGILLAAGSAVGILARLAVGWAADHRGGEQLGVVGVLMGGAGLAYLVVAASAVPVVLVIGTLAAFLTGWGWNALLIYSVARLNPDAPAASTSVTMGGTFAGSVVVPPVFGYVVSTAGFRPAWLMLAAMGVASGVLIAVARRRSEAGP